MDTLTGSLFMYGNKGDGTYGTFEDTSIRIATSKKVPRLLRIDLNPRVSIPAFIGIWVFTIWCMFYENANQNMAQSKTWITDNFTWLYVGTQDVWVLFMIVLYFSKYGALKLGKDDDEPEYPALTWFSMMFSCGVGVGLFYYGVAEPVYHYTQPNRYTADQYRPDNLVAQDAINLTYLHWGVHGWVVYSLVGCLMGFMVYRHGLPMKMSSCFYPILGKKCFGWIGDLIDTLSIVTTLFGVCTSLGLGVIQINSGLHILNQDIPEQDWVRVVIVWGITAVATLSTMSGIDIGIRRLSEVTFTLAMVLMIFVALLQRPMYLLNVYVQSTGYYLQYILQLGFHCDAFEMHSNSTMGTERDRVVDHGTDGPKDWMDSWTIFYWGWWIAWCPFVGVFIAKISKGRTIREFINGTITAPVLYQFAWFAFFGGAGLGTERLAAVEGYCCSQSFASNISAPYNDSGSLLLQSDFENYCPNMSCNPCSQNILNHALSQEMTQIETYNWITGEDKNKMARSDDKSYVRLSCYSLVERWFYTMETHGEFGTFLDVTSLIAITMYFVTSSDSASLIIDILGSNGDLDPPKLQRIFWGLTEGAAATALLKAGGDAALNALQTASIVCALPYTITVCFLCVALWRACAVAYRDLDGQAPEFPVGYLDFASEFNLEIILEWLLAFLMGPFWAAKAACKVWKANDYYNGKTKENASKNYKIYFYVGATYFLLFLCILFHFLHLVINQFWAMAWTSYFGFASMMAMFRWVVRSHNGFAGNSVEDLFAALILYPSVGQQLKRCDELDLNYKRNLHSATQKTEPQMEPPSMVLEPPGLV